MLFFLHKLHMHCLSKQTPYNCVNVHIRPMDIIYTEFARFHFEHYSNTVFGPPRAHDGHPMRVDVTTTTTVHTQIFWKCDQSEVWEFLLKLTHYTGGGRPTANFY
jgi:hypothetical protein